MYIHAAISTSHADSSRTGPEQAKIMTLSFEKMTPLMPHLCSDSFQATSLKPTKSKLLSNFDNCILLVVVK